MFILLWIGGYRLSQPGGAEENNLHPGVKPVKVQTTRNREVSVLNLGQHKVDKTPLVLSNDHRFVGPVWAHLAQPGH